MPPIYYLLEKELIEHKMVTRVPLFIFVCTFLLYLSLLIPSVQGQFHYQGSFNGEFNESGLHYFLFLLTGTLSLLLTSLYLPKTLAKERQEGSAMFWRSMPVSHFMTLIAKLAFALLIIPAVCSVLVLATDLLLWVINITIDNPLTAFFGPSSLVDIMQNWFNFLVVMAVAGLALLPLSCVALAVSQVVSSPILVMVILGYLVKWLAVNLFDFYAISEFYHAIFSIPMTALAAIPLSQNPFTGFIDAGAVNLIIYYGLGVAAFAILLRLRKTNELTLRGLFS